MKPFFAITIVATLFGVQSSAQEIHAEPITWKTSDLQIPVRIADAMNACRNDHNGRRAYIVRWTSGEFVSLVIYSNDDPAEEDKAIPQPHTFWDSADGTALPVISAGSDAAKRLAATKREALCSASFALSELPQKK